MPPSREANEDDEKKEKKNYTKNDEALAFRKMMHRIILFSVVMAVLIILVVHREPLYNTCTEVKDLIRGCFIKSNGTYTTGGMGPYLENRGMHHEKYMHKYFDKYARGNAVDVGANCGFHTRELCKRCDSVLAVEPSKSTIHYLRKNAPCAEILNKALGSEIGTTKLDCGTNKSLCQISGQGRETVSIDTLDNVMKNTPLDFLKIDVEGHEFDVIKGGLKTISTHKPTIIYESHLFSNDKVKNLLSSMGYNIKSISLRDRLARHRTKIF
tara:strand:- start:44 stop:850 length:807 start_codon:yes stop_codon:yes gene_type:complete